MSSLQAQLSKLKPTTVFLPTTGTASILFSFTQASSLSPASIYPLARLSMQNLVLLQPILATFIAEFFPSNNFQDIYNRDLWT